MSSKIKVESEVRLNKFISDCAVASRRKADEMIEAGRVQVNGILIQNPGLKISPSTDRVLVNRKLIRPQVKGVVIFHKPKGVITTLHDPEGRPSISDYLTKRFRGYFPAGRLDYDSTGLVILTNDGELAEALMHPRYGAPRVYQVKVEGRVLNSVLLRITSGIKLHDGPVKVQNLKVLQPKDIIMAKDVVNPRNQREAQISEQHTWLEITVSEGRNRLVRRLFESVSHPVLKLKRISHGPFKLGNLKPGEIRPLSERDYSFYRSKVLK